MLKILGIWQIHSGVVGVEEIVSLGYIKGVNYTAVPYYSTKHHHNWLRCSGVLWQNNHFSPILVLPQILHHCINTFFLAKALLQSEYYPITGYGPSPLHNSHLSKHSHCGPNQGSTDGSLGCVLVSNTLIKVYEKNVPGITFSCPENKCTWSHKVEQFVDDTNMYHDAERDNFFNLTSKEISLWIAFLHFTGGSIKLSSSIKMLIHKFTPESRHYVQDIEEQRMTILNPSTISTQTIPIKSPKTPKKIWECIATC